MNRRCLAIDTGPASHSRGKIGSVMADDTPPNVLSYSTPPRREGIDPIRLAARILTAFFLIPLGLLVVYLAIYEPPSDAVTRVLGTGMGSALILFGTWFLWWSFSRSRRARRALAITAANRA